MEDKIETALGRLFLLNYTHGMSVRIIKTN